MRVRIVVQDNVLRCQRQVLYFGVRIQIAMNSTLHGLRVLEPLAEEPSELSLSDLAARLAIPRPSVHRLCAKLLELQLIEENRRMRRYVLTTNAVWIGSGSLRHSSRLPVRFFPDTGIGQGDTGRRTTRGRHGGQGLFIHSAGSPGSPPALICQAAEKSSIQLGNH